MAKPRIRQVWSNIDVFGLLNGISTWDEQYKTLRYVRKPFDTPKTLRNKILLNNQYPADTTRQGVINGLSNEFSFIPYNVHDITTFELTHQPAVIGPSGVQDIHVYYQPPMYTGWYEILPQVWNETYTLAKQEKAGFIVWNADRVTNLSGYKNFGYSKNLEILKDIDDKSQLKIVYSVYVTDKDNKSTTTSYTDMNNLGDATDTKYLYRKSVIPSPTGHLLVYNLNEIPSGVHSYYYNSDGSPTNLILKIRDYVNSEFKHNWEKIEDRSTIWDIHKVIGSGEISSLYDAYVPINAYLPISSSIANSGFYSGYLGGIEPGSTSLYPTDLVETGNANSWYLKVYPGLFYVDGIPFYMFENPESAYITFVSGVANTPSGLSRGAHTIMSISGYYSSNPDTTLANFVYEDHHYPTGEKGNYNWSNIYRRVPYINPSINPQPQLSNGEYSIDFDNNKIIASGMLDHTAFLVWEKALVPSGKFIPFDLNPLNTMSGFFANYFVYLKLKKDA